MCPALHAHRKTPAATGWRPPLLLVRESVQLPPFRHGWLAHSSRSVSHLLPLKPAAHAQWYTPTATSELVVESEQLPPFRHGLLLHSLISLTPSHRLPLKPSLHAQWKECAETLALLFRESVHVAPFWHGWLAHSSKSVSQLLPLKPAAHTHS